MTMVAGKYEDDMIAAEFDKIIAERDYAKTLKDAAVAQLAIARQERDALREELAALRAIAQAALDKGGDKELVYAPLYQQALEDIASEEQDDETTT